MFACDKLDDGTRWLKVDYSISCDGVAHWWMELYAYLMVALYPIGTPLIFALVMIRHHETLSRLQRSEVRAELQKRSNQLRKDSVDQGAILLRSELIVTELPANIAKEYHAQVRKWAVVSIELAWHWHARGSSVRPVLPIHPLTEMIERGDLKLGCSKRPSVVILQRGRLAWFTARSKHAPDGKRDFVWQSARICFKYSGCFRPFPTLMILVLPMLSQMPMRECPTVSSGSARGAWSHVLDQLKPKSTQSR